MKKTISPEDRMAISQELVKHRDKMSFTELKKHIKKTFPGVPVIVNKNYGFEVEKSEGDA